MSTIHARLRFEKGLLKPVDPVALPFAEGEEVEAEIAGPPEPPDVAEAKLARQKAAIREISGIVKDNGPTDWSIRHDEILYGPVRSDERNAR